MRYSKKHVNEIVAEVLNQVSHLLESNNPGEFDQQIELIREEHLLIDRRVTSLPEYATDVVRDFLELGLSYKELMAKYHCSMRTLKKLLYECSESDQRVYNEIEMRRR